jgi:hypothetical protein
MYGKSGANSRERERERERERAIFVPGTNVIQKKFTAAFRALLHGKIVSCGRKNVNWAHCAMSIMKSGYSKINS